MCESRKTRSLLENLRRARFSVTRLRARTSDIHHNGRGARYLHPAASNSQANSRSQFMTANRETKLSWFQSTPRSKNVVNTETVGLMPTVLLRQVCYQFSKTPRSTARGEIYERAEN